VFAVPPKSEGADQVTTSWLAFGEDAVGAEGALGFVVGVAELEVAGWLFPAAFDATTVKV